MKKKSILGRVGIVAAALTLATTSMMSGTLARYAMSKSVAAEAIIAKWAPTIKNGDTVINETNATIDLVDTIDVGGSTAKVDNIGKAGQDRIAPGTKGSTTIKVDVTGAEVPTICTIAAKQKDGYTMPGHINVTIKDGTKVIGTLKSEWDADNLKYKDPFDGNDVILVGNSTNKALLFPSARDNSSGNLQSKTFMLEWEWPLDLADMTNPGESGTNAADAFNETDYNVGRKATDTTKFGFDLVISLKQQGKSADEQAPNVVPVTP